MTTRVWSEPTHPRALSNNVTSSDRDGRRVSQNKRQNCYSKVQDGFAESQNYPTCICCNGALMIFFMNKNDAFEIKAEENQKNR